MSRVPTFLPSNIQTISVKSDYTVSAQEWTDSINYMYMSLSWNGNWWTPLCYCGKDRPGFNFHSKECPKHGYA